MPLCSARRRGLASRIPDNVSRVQSFVTRPLPRSETLPPIRLPLQCEPSFGRMRRVMTREHESSMRAAREQHDSSMRAGIMKEPLGSGPEGYRRGGTPGIRRVSARNVNQ